MQQFVNRVPTINTLDIPATKRNDLTDISCLSKQLNILLGQEIDILQNKKLYKSAPSSGPTFQNPLYLTAFGDEENQVVS